MRNHQSCTFREFEWSFSEVRLNPHQGTLRDAWPSFFQFGFPSAPKPCLCWINRHPVAFFRNLIHEFGVGKFQEPRRSRLEDGDPADVNANLPVLIEDLQRILKFVIRRVSVTQDYDSSV